MTQFLGFAVGLARALSGLHKSDLIHKDVKPANVLVNTATGQARLLGFAIASRLPRERQAAEPPPFIAGTLAYFRGRSLRKEPPFPESRGKTPRSEARTGSRT
jgi:serine/threonine protein kinase